MLYLRLLFATGHMKLLFFLLNECFIKCEFKRTNGFVELLN